MTGARNVTVLMLSLSTNATEVFLCNILDSTRYSVSRIIMKPCPMTRSASVFSYSEHSETSKLKRPWIILDVTSTNHINRPPKFGKFSESFCRENFGAPFLLIHYSARWWLQFELITRMTEFPTVSDGFPSAHYFNEIYVKRLGLMWPKRTGRISKMLKATALDRTMTTTTLRRFLSAS